MNVNVPISFKYFANISFIRKKTQTPTLIHLLSKKKKRRSPHFVYVCVVLIIFNTEFELACHILDKLSENIKSNCLRMTERERERNKTRKVLNEMLNLKLIRKWLVKMRIIVQFMENLMVHYDSFERFIVLFVSFILFGYFINGSKPLH